MLAIMLRVVYTGASGFFSLIHSTICAMLHSAGIRHFHTDLELREPVEFKPLYLNGILMVFSP